MLYVPLRLCTFMFLLPMCLCNSIICTLLHFTPLYYLCVLSCQNYLFALRCVFEKGTFNTSALSFVILVFLFLVPIFLPWFLYPCFSVLSPLSYCNSSNILRTKKWIFSNFFFFFFFYQGFLSRTFTIHGTAGKGEGIYLTPLYHFHPLHWHLGISRAITAESSPLHIAGSRTRTGNLWFPSASR